MPSNDFKISKIQRNDNNCYVFVNFYVGDFLKEDGKNIYKRTGKLRSERFKFPAKITEKEIINVITEKFNKEKIFNPIPEQKHVPK